jgi:hypothetical protein
MATRLRDQLRSGREAIQAAIEGDGATGNRFTPVHKFETGETKFLQFLDSIDAWIEVQMHQFIIVGYRNDGGEIYERFISRKDSNIDGPDGYDELVDRFHQKPSRRVIALAVEMTPVTETKAGKKTITGFKVADRQYENSEGETITVPNVALVIESPFTLFKHLDAVADIGPIEDMVVSIKVTGKGKDKTFSPLPTGHAAIDLSEDLADFFETFDFDDYIDELASAERMEEMIGSLPDDWKISNFPTKGTEPKPVGKRRPSTPETEEAEESTPKETRFADLRQKTRSRASSQDD